MSDSVAQLLTIGPFELGSALGKGGMGKVYRGLHRASDVQVAIKVLDGEGLGKGDVEGFYREARAVAGLDHPHIVKIYDFGTLPEDWEHPDLQAGAPWLAMEMCRGGSLAGRGPRDWGDLVVILEQLLSGLSSAHARGVLHRDLKPDNLLLARPPEESWDLRIVDFGLAFETQTGVSDEGIRGTPRYMAPEQFLGQWRHFGPWTDLYALGCLAWRLVTGESPFGQMMSIQQLAKAHVRMAPPPLAPGFQVPSTLEGWLRTLLAKDPRDRFMNAAQAADSLQGLALDHMIEPHPISIQRLGLEGYHITDDSLSRKTLSVVQGAAQPVSSTLTEHVTQAVTVAVTLQDEQVEISGAVADEKVAWKTRPIDVPKTWRVGQWMSDRQSFSGAGIALLGLREPPFVDRAIIRDRLWTLLVETGQQRRPQLVLLEGEQGQGKSRLAQWLGERAVELGAAQCLRVSHCDQPTAASGVEGAIERACMAQELPPRPLQEQLGWRLDSGLLSPRDIKSLTRLLVGEEGLTTTGSQDLSVLAPGERERLLARVLTSMTQHGPLILWIDDVQWGEDSLQLVQYLSQQAAEMDCPLLVLMTLVPSLVGEGSLCETLLATFEAIRLPVGPLSAPDAAQLIRDHLPVSEPLSLALAGQSAGRPSIAVNLVEQLVAEHRLVNSREGFVLADGDELDLPEDMVDLWARRLQQVLGGQINDALPFLELAALLGQEAEVHELMQAGQEAGLPWQEEFLDRLDRAGLVTFRARGLVMRFADSQLHHLLLDRCRQSGRWKDQHEAITRMLTSRFGEDHGVEAARLATHRQEAEDFEGAARAYMVAARHRMRRGEYDRALLMGEAAETCLEVVASQSRLHGEVEILMGMLACHRGAFDELGVRSQRAVEASGKELRLMAHILASRWHHVSGEPRIANEMLDTASGLAQGPRERLLVTIELLRLARRLGKIERSQGLLVKLNSLRVHETDERILAKASMASGQVLFTLERWQESLDEFQFASTAFQGANMALGEADALNCAGRVLGQLEKVDDAVRALMGASTIYASLNHPAEVFPMLTQGVIELEAGRYRAARSTLNQALDRVLAGGRADLIGPTHAVLVPCAAAAGDWEAYDLHLTEAGERLASGGVIDKDIAEPLMMAGNLARAQSQDARAREAYMLARRQWQGLGQEAKIQTIDEAVSLLGDA